MVERPEQSGRTTTSMPPRLRRDARSRRSHPCEEAAEKEWSRSRMGGQHERGQRDGGITSTGRKIRCRGVGGGGGPSKAEEGVPQPGEVEEDKESSDSSDAKKKKKHKKKKKKKKKKKTFKVKGKKGYAVLFDGTGLDHLGSLATSAESWAAAKESREEMRNKQLQRGSWDTTTWKGGKFGPRAKGS